MPKTKFVPSPVLYYIVLSLFFAFLFQASASPAFAATGSISVCKVITNGDGCIVDGSERSGTTFRLNWFSPGNLNPDITSNSKYNIVGSSGIPPQVSFTTPLTLNTKLEGFPDGPGSNGYNARCVTFSNLPLNYTGTPGDDPAEQGGPYDFANYFYREETISSSGWNRPRYNDGWDSSASLTDIFTYDDTYYDGDFSNDPPSPTTGSINRNAEGLVALFWMYDASDGSIGIARPDRTLVLYNQYGGTADPRSCAPTNTGVPSSTNTLTPTRTPTPSPTPLPISCNVTSSENPIQIPAGTSRPLTAGPVSISCSGGYLSYQATYTVNPSVVGVCGSPPCSSGSYTDTPSIQVRSTAVGTVGSTTPLTVTVSDQTTGSVLATGNFTIRVTNTNPWFQSLNGDVISNGTVMTTIPTTCTSPTCRDWLLNYSSTRASGIAIGYSGVTVNSTSGVVSSPNNWQSESEYKGTLYDYGYFEKHASCGVVHDYGAANKFANDVNYFTNFGANANGYHWVRYTGDSGNPLTIGGGSDLLFGSNKVILFVKNADVIIKNKIRVTPGRGFFMIVAGNTDGSSTGNIIIDPSVGDAPTSSPDPDLEGIYYTQEQFRTGTFGPSLDKQLYVRGSVAAFDKIVLQRNLTNNATYPAELFEYGAEFLINYPECLGDRTTSWREEAP